MRVHVSDDGIGGANPGGGTGLTGLSDRIEALPPGRRSRRICRMPDRMPAFQPAGPPRSGPSVLVIEDLRTVGPPPCSVSTSQTREGSSTSRMKHIRLLRRGRARAELGRSRLAVPRERWPRQQEAKLSSPKPSKTWSQEAASDSPTTANTISRASQTGGTSTPWRQPPSVRARRSNTPSRAHGPAGR